MGMGWFRCSDTPPNPAGPNENCADRGCERGYLCMRLSRDIERGFRCRKYCGSDADCGVASCQTVRAPMAAGCGEADLKVCDTRGAICGLFGSVGCTDNLGCYCAGATPKCQAPGIIPVGSPCAPDKDNDCVPGAACFPAADAPQSWKCHKLCRVSRMDCLAGQACVGGISCTGGPTMPDLGYCR
jgi:hypothetical protein